MIKSTIFIKHFRTAAYELFSRRDSIADAFLQILRNLKGALFYEKHRNCCFCPGIQQNSSAIASHLEPS